MIKSTTILLLLSILFTKSICSQTFSFKYQYGATEKFINFDEVEIDTERGEIAHKYLSFYRKVFYSNVFMKGYQNDSMFYYFLDFSEFSKIHSDSFSFSVYGIPSEKREINLDFTGFADSNRISKLSNKTYAVNIKNDSVRVKYYVENEELIETLEQKEINGWLCNKWIPADESIQNKIEIWVSKEVPKQINLGLFSKDLNGGVVEIFWEQGVFHRLISYKEESFDFPTDYLYNDMKISEKKSTNFLRSGLKIGSSDRLDEKIEFESTEMKDLYKSPTE